MTDTAEYVICRRHHLPSNIRKDLDRFDPIFDAATFEELKASLAALAEGSTQTTRTQHIVEAQKVASGNVCPWCGSELVRRNGKYGPFMGCYVASGCPRTAAPMAGRWGKQRRGAVAAVYRLRLTMLGSAPLWSSAILSSAVPVAPVALFSTWHTGCGSRCVSAAPISSGS